jgi:hypothetical protein
MKAMLLFLLPLLVAEEKALPIDMNDLKAVAMATDAKPVEALKEKYDGKRITVAGEAHLDRTEGERKVYSLHIVGSEPNGRRGSKPWAIDVVFTVKDPQEDKGLDAAISQALRDALKTRKKPAPVNLAVTGTAKVGTGKTPLTIELAGIEIK